MTRSVLFYYNNKVESVLMWGKTLEALTEKCMKRCYNVGAIHFEILDSKRRG